MKSPLKMAFLSAATILLTISCQKEEKPDAAIKSQTEIQKAL